MQISSTFKSFQAPKTAPSLAVEKQSTFQPASQTDIADIGNSIQSQDRWDYGRGLSEAMYGLGGAAVGTVTLTVGAAALGFSGWGTAGAGLVGLIAGGAIGGHFGSK